MLLHLGQLLHRINISIWATAHLPLPQPNINPNLLSIDNKLGLMLGWGRGRWAVAQILILIL